MKHTMRRQPENNSQIIIIGGGASGLAAACLCAERGLRVTLLEKEARVGRKLLATGNGRCNLINLGEPAYFGDTAFAGAVLSRCGVPQVRDFWQGLGLLIREEADGRAYPAAGQAAAVLDCLRLRLEASPCCGIHTGETVTGIKREAEGLTVVTGTGKKYQAPFVLAAAGGPAAPRLGGSDSLMKPLAALGHRVIPFRPALCPLVTDTRAIRGLSGLRLPARLGLKAEGRIVAASSGEALFTDYGVSGVCAMQLARDAEAALARGQRAALVIDFSPGMGLTPPLMGRVSPAEFEKQAGQAREKLSGLLAARRARFGRDWLYLGLLPRLLADKVQGLSLEEAARYLTGLSLEVTGVKGFDQAQAASGGLDCRDFDPATLASRLVPGLYAAGEMLNVDGDCGGYNLLFAWATAILAARDIIARAPAAGS